MRSFLVLATVCARAALAAASGGLAGQPVTQPLNPPPPPWQTCKAVGNGTICEGTQRRVIRPDRHRHRLRQRRERVRHLRHRHRRLLRLEEVRRGRQPRPPRLPRPLHVRQFSNPLTGAVVPYTQTDTRIDVLAVPGDLSSATETTTWGSVVHLPGAGAPVFWNSGRTMQFPIFGPTEFSAGRLGFFELLDGDTSVLGPLCAALGG